MGNSRAAASEAAVEELVELGERWGLQDTDYDEDTETQINDGLELLSVLAKHGLYQPSAKAKTTLEWRQGNGLTDAIVALSNG